MLQIDLQLRFVQEPYADIFFCALFASAETGLLGVVDKEKKMNNLYFTFSQRLPIGLLSREDIPGLLSQSEGTCQAQPFVPLFTLRYYPDRNIRLWGLIIFFLFWSLEKGMLFIIHW